MNRNRLTLLFIAALFGLPLIAAWLMQSGLLDWRPAQTVNLGHLVEPPVTLSLETDQKWQLLYLLPVACDVACEDDVTGLRQVHRAAGRHRDKIAVLLLSEGAAAHPDSQRLSAIDPGFRLATDADGQLDTALREAMRRAGLAEAGDRRSAFVLDPGANVILAYAAGFNPNHINRDLKRLLTWSAQDE